MSTCQCGAEIVPLDETNSLSVPAGWCAPSATLYDMAEPDPMCSGCSTRLLMIMTLGIDPGPNGKNLRVARGGITYGATQ